MRGLRRHEIGCVSESYGQPSKLRFVVVSHDAKISEHLRAVREPAAVRLQVRYCKYRGVPLAVTANRVGLSLSESVL